MTERPVVEWDGDSAFKVPNSIAPHIGPLLGKLIEAQQRESEMVKVHNFDLQEWYNTLNDIVHTLDDDGSGLLTDLTDLRDSIYSFLK